jgi:hypothetical protein
MTRISGPTSYPAPPALDSAAGVAAAARPARASRSRDGSPLAAPGAPDSLAAKPSAQAGTPPRTASARLFAGRDVPDDAADPPGHAAAHAGAGPGPDPQPDVGAALFITVSRLCRAGDGKLDPVFTFRLPGSPSSPQALLFKVAAQSRRAAGKATLLQDLIATAGVTGTPVVLYCDADADADPGPLDALFAAPATRATTMLWAHCGGVGRAAGMGAADRRSSRPLPVRHGGAQRACEGGGLEGDRRPVRAAAGGVDARRPARRHGRQLCAPGAGCAPEDAGVRAARAHAGVRGRTAARLGAR